MKNGTRVGGLLLAGGLTAGWLSAMAAEEAAPAKAEAAAIKTKVVAEQLDNPCGIAVSAKTGHFAVAARTGVYHWVLGEKNLRKVVEGFPTDIYGKGPMYNIGPLGVAFLGDEKVVVGDGSRPDGEELAYVFNLDGEEHAKKRKVEEADQTLGPIKAGEQSAKGEGNFYGVAVTDKAIFFTCNGDDTKGWVAKADITDGKAGELKPFIATKVATNVDAPVGITVSKDGQLVIGQMGEINVPADALLTFYDPATGELKKKYTTGLNDITGLAYSPKTGKLYVTDFSWMDTTKGGLFRLDVGEGDSAAAEKILGLDKPTALAFDAEGNLFITVLGTKPEGSDKNPGQILKIDSGL